MPTVDEVLRFKTGEGPACPTSSPSSRTRRSGEAIDLMQQYSISQLPVVRNGPAESLADVIGSLQERGLLDRVFRNPDALNEEVAAAMGRRSPPWTPPSPSTRYSRTSAAGARPSWSRARAGRPGC